MSFVLTLRISLDSVTPEVWRTIMVPESLPLTRLHDVIQAAMGWDDSHLHSYKFGDTEYTDKQLNPESDWADDEGKMTLKKAVLSVGDTFSYTYDMGDNWKHTITVVEKKRMDKGEDVFHIADGANACPPEDVGGTSGYENFIAAMSDTDHDEHDDFIEWWGRVFYPTVFDLSAARRLLFVVIYSGAGYPWEDGNPRA